MRILMIEDNEELSNAVCFQLEKEGYTVDICFDGDDGLRWMLEKAHDLVLLDRLLPYMNGIEILHKARRQGVTTPVLMITALDGVGDRVDGLDAGADDYLVKPFAVEELLARIRAMGRRPRGWENSPRLSCGDVSFDISERKLYGKGGVCSLSRREADLIEVLIKNAGQTLPRQTLLSYVWGPDASVEDGNLDNYIHFLRRRLKNVDSTLGIKTVRGIGYRMESLC